MKLLGFIIVLLGFICPMQVSAFMSHNMEETHQAISEDQEFAQGSMNAMECLANGCFKSHAPSNLSSNLSNGASPDLKGSAAVFIQKHSAPQLAYSGFTGSGQRKDTALSQTVSTIILRI